MIDDQTNQMMDCVNGKSYAIESSIWKIVSILEPTGIYVQLGDSYRTNPSAKNLIEQWAILADSFRP